MPERLSSSLDLEEGENEFTERYYERMFGPIIASFTPELVLGYDYPKEIRDAWQGVTLPVRREFERALNEGTVQVATGEAINALATSEVEGHILQYWSYSLPNDPRATLDFSSEEGTLEYLDDRP